jgi:putative ABC transport system permease protein
MPVLYRKLLRELWRMRGQVLSIALVMASGVAVLVMSLSTVDALLETTDAYYERQSFGQVFAQVERAPEYLTERLAKIPGVQTVETRVVHTAVLDIEGFTEPVIGQLVSVPERTAAKLNRLSLRAGRLPRAGAADEVVLSEPFATAQHLEPGDRFRAILNTSWRELTVVGIALSPEYVYAIAPGGLMPDDARFGVLWLGHEAMQGAFDLDGAFNDVSMTLLPGTDAEEVVDRVDGLLRRYGGTGAYARADQISNWFLMNEIAEQRTLATFLPAVFLAVAAFLTNTLFARLISVERSEIGLLKAFGYTQADIAWHYIRFVLAVGALGIALGWFIGYWLGRYQTGLYADFFHFPFLLFNPGPKAFAIGAVASLGAALSGAIGAVRQAAALPPAEAMRPPAPPLFRRALLSGSRLSAALDQPTRIILRQIGRWPGRSLITSFGIGMAVAVLVTSMQWLDAIDRIKEIYFRQAQLQDVVVSFVSVRSSEAVRALATLPGVRAVEPLRAVPAKLRVGQREQREAIQGVPAHQNLYRVYDVSGHGIDLPPEGLVISTMLATMLAVKPGDLVTVEVLEGRRPTVQVPVAGVFETYIGSPAYMESNALSRLLKERPSVTTVNLLTDPTRRDELFKALKRLPHIGAVTLKDVALVMFDETMADTILIFVRFFIVFSCTLAFGVTYNAARIALAERGREFATLRVLGFTRGEISYCLLGELGLLTLAALPLGCVLGFGLAGFLVRGLETELYRIPLVIDNSTYGLAMLIGLAAAVVSAMIVRRRLDRLDLIAVLKTRE